MIQQPAELEMKSDAGSEFERSAEPERNSN